MKNKDNTLSNLSKEELQAKLSEQQAAYNSLRMSHKVSPIENPILIRQQRRNIARISTLLTQKQNTK